MKSVVRTVFAISLLACSHGMTETPGEVASAPIPVQKAATPAVKASPAGMMKDTVADKKEAARKKHVEGIRKMQDAQDSLNSAFADSLRKQAKRSHQERESGKTGGATGYPKVPPAGVSPKKSK